MSRHNVTADVGGRIVGGGEPPYVIAEAGVNHNGDVDLARRLAAAAQAAGADAVKFQAFDAQELADASAPKAAYQLRQTSGAESQMQMLSRLELSGEALAELAEHCRRLGITFMASAFDARSIDRLDAIGVAAHKIASGELTNLSLLRRAGASGRTVMLSTGMADLDEVRLAVETLREAGAPAVVLLQCTSQYPASPSDVNLRAMQTLRETFGVPVGFSDHTEGIDIALAAAALGAAVIEKHVTLDRAMGGPDHAASIEPAELARLVQGVRRVTEALGDGVKRPAAAELETREVVRRRLVARTDVPAGSLLDESLLIARRSSSGISPADMARVIGRRARHGIPAGAPIEWADVE